MKVYLASSFRFAEKVAALCRTLEAAGHQVPDKWWDVDSKNDAWAVLLDDETWQVHPISRSIAQRHWGAIGDADALVIVNGGEKPTTFTGANIEVGFAIGRGIPVLSLGPMERSAMYVPVIPTKSEQQLVHLLDILAVRDRKLEKVQVF